MSTAPEFVDGLLVKAPRVGAPDFVKASISIKRAELIAWLSARNDDWINLDVKVGNSGKWYAAVFAYKPKEGKPTGKPQTPPDGYLVDDEIPF